MIKKIIIIVLLVSLGQLQAFSLAFLPSSNYQYSDNCDHPAPFCPYGDLWVKFQYKDGSVGPVQQVKCGTVGTIIPDTSKGTPKYIILSGAQHATLNYQSEFDFDVLGGLTPVATTCSEHSGNPKFALAGIDGSSHAWDVLNYRLRNGIPFGTNMWDFDPVFKKEASCD